MSIYIHDLMEIHRHKSVFIYSVTKNSMFLGLTSVDFYHPYTDLEKVQASIRVVEINAR